MCLYVPICVYPFGYNCISVYLYIFNPKPDSSLFYSNLSGAQRGLEITRKEGVLGLTFVLAGES